MFTACAFKGYWEPLIGTLSRDTDTEWPKHKNDSFNIVTWLTSVRPSFIVLLNQCSPFAIIPQLYNTLPLVTTDTLYQYYWHMPQAQARHWPRYTLDPSGYCSSTTRYALWECGRGEGPKSNGIYSWLIMYSVCNCSLTELAYHRVRCQRHHTVSSIDIMNNWIVCIDMEEREGKKNHSYQLAARQL